MARDSETIPYKMFIFDTNSKNSRKNQPHACPVKLFARVPEAAVQVWNSLYIMSLFISEFPYKNNYDF